jgi:hypothetical protein
LRGDGGEGREGIKEMEELFEGQKCGIQGYALLELKSGINNMN